MLIAFRATRIFYTIYYKYKTQKCRILVQIKYFTNTDVLYKLLSKNCHLSTYYFY